MTTTELYLDELTSDGSRILREQAWHDRRFADARERSARLELMTSAMTLDALRIAYQAARGRCRGGRVLDYGCARGEGARILRRYGAASVHGIDISPVAIRHATELAAAEELSNVTFEVMNAEELAFPDAHFDFVFGVGILHHLHVSRAFAEVARVLKTHGSAVFLEPLTHNPFIAAIRHLTPYARTPDEHPLTMADLRRARYHFNAVSERYVNLATLVGAPLTGLRGSSRVHRGLAAADAWLLRLPWLSRFAWNVVLTLEKPKLH
jgi:SAM-dependent methyltransferase